MKVIYFLLKNKNKIYFFIYFLIFIFILFNIFNQDYISVFSRLNSITETYNRLNYIFNILQLFYIKYK